ncbi:hypothetical protein RSOLAG1IB_08926 [Rhizoctonia solani AG-1 IB]|uniref:Uncharacterized protein n=1 Tax=Thanatephorus cucumeris (strain AG1-IB / isolate 7/3/14) TaxID=1108050 RepID=A0A0B7FLP9_THACB|nr:hypothetical protein RSOLAG1IB_08926 [Rhizoctonia solani AG-1 IB]
MIDFLAEQKRDGSFYRRMGTSTNIPKQQVATPSLQGVEMEAGNFGPLRVGMLRAMHDIHDLRFLRDTKL